MRRAVPLVLPALLLAALSGCGPVPVQDAERTCLRDAQAARAPQSRVAIGVATDGHRVSPVAGLSLSISSDYIGGRDPSQVFDQCVVRRSGQVPTRSLAEQPGWAR